MILLEKKLNEAVALGNEKGLFENLDSLYGTIRSGQCAGCTRCCAESVNAFYVEFLAIWNRMQQDPALKNRLMKRIIRYYMLEMVERTSCPFLDGAGRCEVYAQRPLVCRQFGHWSRRDFNRNIDAVLKANREAAVYYQEAYGLKLPEAAVNQTLQYCEEFSVTQKTGPMKRGEQTDTVFMLDVHFLNHGLLDEALIGTPLVTWFIYTLYSPEEAGELRLRIMEEYLRDGESDTLQGIIG